jgi:hypothetical protein
VHSADVTPRSGAWDLSSMVSWAVVSALFAAEASYLECLPVAFSPPFSSVGGLSMALRNAYGAYELYPQPVRHHKTSRSPATRYADAVQFLFQHGYPNLAFLSSFLDARSDKRFNPSRITLVTFMGDGQVEHRDLQGGRTRPARDDNELIGLLESELRSEPVRGTIGQVVLVEDLSPPVANCLGLVLDIHPEFFAGHIRDTWMETGQWRGSAPALPSVAKKRPFFSIDYMSAITSRRLQDIENTYLHCGYNYRRRVDVNRDSGVGMARRKISYWLDRKSDPWTCKASFFSYVGGYRGV